MLHTHRAKVVGRGQFPIDMLRYDACHPATEACSTAIAATFAPHVNLSEVETRSVTVVQQHLSVRPNWTPERWASFGWTLGEVS